LPEAKRCTGELWATLEIEDLLVVLEETPVHGLWQIRVQAHARLVRAGDRTVLAERLFIDDLGGAHYIKGVYGLPGSWIHDDAKLFREELDSALKRLSKDIIDALFVQTEAPDAATSH
jgi:hypothetical protein